MNKLIECLFMNDLSAADDAIKNGQPVDETDRDGQTALMQAVVQNAKAFAQLLLENGADANAADRRGWTPLHFAAQNDSLEHIVLLRKFGANPNAIDAWGNTVISKAVFNYCGNDTVIRELLSMGADPDVANKSGVSAKSLSETIANYDSRHLF